jgi:hypothetical protein
MLARRIVQYAAELLAADSHGHKKAGVEARIQRHRSCRPDGCAAVRDAAACAAVRDAAACALVTRLDWDERLRRRLSSMK